MCVCARLSAWPSRKRPPFAPNHALHRRLHQTTAYTKPQLALYTKPGLGQPPFTPNDALHQRFTSEFGHAVCPGGGDHRIEHTYSICNALHNTCTYHILSPCLLLSTPSIYTLHIRFATSKSYSNSGLLIYLALSFSLHICLSSVGLFRVPNNFIMFHLYIQRGYSCAWCFLPRCCLLWVSLSARVHVYENSGQPIECEQKFWVCWWLRLCRHGLGKLSLRQSGRISLIPPTRRRRLAHHG